MLYELEQAASDEGWNGQTNRSGMDTEASIHPAPAGSIFGTGEFLRWKDAIKTDQ